MSLFKKIAKRVSRPRGTAKRAGKSLYRAAKKSTRGVRRDAKSIGRGAYTLSGLSGIRKVTRTLRRTTKNTPKRGRK